MTQIDVLSPSVTSTPASFSKLESPRRLIVLVSAVESDYLPAVRRIRELALTQSAGILLISLCKDPTQEPSLRRDLITMLALLRDESFQVEVKVEVGTSWVDVVKRNYQTGDMVVCFAEQRAGLLHKPLSQILQSNLKMPVYILTGLSVEKTKSNVLSQVMAWLGSIGIIIGFFALQANIVQASKGGLQSILLILCIIPEFWLIFFWNSRFG